MARAQYRILLDQNFPSPVFGVDDLDNTVSFRSLWQHKPALARSSTPDWLIYLDADASGFNGMVTRDLNQITEVESLVALAYTDLCVITWAKPIEDPITEWAQLIAFTPEIKSRLSEGTRRIILLPAPRLRSEQLRRATDYLHEYASRERTTADELRAGALALMRQELRARDRHDLLGRL